MNICQIFSNHSFLSSVFQIKLMGQLYMQHSNTHKSSPGLKLQVHLTPRVSLSFSQKSCSGLKAHGPLIATRG